MQNFKENEKNECVNHEPEQTGSKRKANQQIVSTY